ncbi:adenylate kinase [Kribbella aluminosa]|uniref:Adenylate kinase n=1 Tax=Kribbella aluminosa TaxID=416017 RepID=A0ABS4UEE6_9ACTN|nr:adenylate kinase [Kribbella aluminosa]MBP2350023.1 adenylate kinase [Kribbella aluminosa]
MTTVLLMGPPGAGKGTHAGHLAGHLGVPVISTGDLFRRNIADGTDLGRTAQRYLDAGEYVPDEVTNDMVRDRLAAPDARPGFVLDGYPRTLDQAGVLDGILSGQGRSLDAAVVLTVPIDALVGRLLKRAEIEHRSDDTEEVIRRRFEVYHEQTAPLLEFYSARGLDHEVDASPDIDTVRIHVRQVAVQLKQAA